MICGLSVAASILFALSAGGEVPALELSGMAVTPHVVADSMRYSKEPEPLAGARVQLFLLHNAPSGAAPLTLDADTRVLFDGKTPAELIQGQAWNWHDTPAAASGESASLAPGALTVWTFNGRSAPFGPGGKARMTVGPERAPWLSREVAFDEPRYWLSAVTFLAPEGAIAPDTMVVHLANASKEEVVIRSCRLWLPADGHTPRVLLAQPPLQHLVPFNGHHAIPAGDRGGFVAKTGPLPLTYAAVEVTIEGDGGEQSVWASLRIKPEHFDISGGWVNGDVNPLSTEIFCKTLKRLYVNTAHMAFTPGYSDTALFTQYPFKYFNELRPFDVYDTDEMLPRIHAVEFLGEPQYGGGRPVPPQEVWERLRPYAFTRLATTVTHSEERIWRDYAGLTDFPHYDAYRVSAPSPDRWRDYERWGKKRTERIGWGAPLETIGDMCRSLRELNRPMPCAIWSQGPCDGWGVYGGRKRTTPTPDELRMQAYHALATRITSLYWFNLSLKSLVKWRDTLDELGRVGREIRLLDDFLLEGDAYHFARIVRGKIYEWDLASVCGPRAALLFALDLNYVPDPKEKVFRFGPPRDVKFTFPMPAYLENVGDVFRIDADGIREVKWSAKRGKVQIHDAASRVAVYIATGDPQLRAALENERQQLLAGEAALQCDPARNDADFQQLVDLLKKK